MMTLSTKLATVGASNEVLVKGKMQKLVFPEGVSYNHKNGAFLTMKVNEVFVAIPRLNCIPEEDNNKQDSIAAALSNFVGAAGPISNQYWEDLIDIQRLKHLINGNGLFFASQKE